MRARRKTGAWFALIALGMAAVVVLFFGSGKFAPTLRTETEEVEQRLRVSAQRLESGRVQFGVRVADASGGWSDPVEPRAKQFLPSNRTANRWLSSSSLTVKRVGGSPAVVRTEAFEATEPAPIDIRVVSTTWSGDIRYETTLYDDAAATSVSMYFPADGAVDGELRVNLTCDDDGLAAAIGGLPSDDAQSARSVGWSVDSGRTQAERWSPWPVEGGLELLPPSNSGLAGALLSGGQMLTLSISGSSAVATEIDLSALQEIPVYSSLTACGASQTVLIGNTEVRIQAHLHQEGNDTSGARIEFALQQRGDDGEWGERILPRGRYMSAYGDPTNWLSSTPINLAVHLQSIRREATLVHVVGESEPKDVAINPRLRRGGGAGSVEFEAIYDPASSAVNSYLKLPSEGPLVLEVSCVLGRRTVGLDGIPEELGDGLAFDLGEQRSTIMWANGAFDADRVFRRLAPHSTLVIGAGSVAASTFDLSRLFSTPIQPNLEQCGNYSDPAWTPITKEQSGRVGDDVGYGLSVADHRNLGVEDKSSIQIERKLGMDCFSALSPSLSWIQSYVFPGSQLAIGTYTARIKADGVWHDGEWEFIKYSDDGALHISRQYVVAYHELLWSSSEVEFSFNGHPRAKRVIDLSQIFTTPLQANIENCGAPLWPVVNDYATNGDTQLGDDPSSALSTSDFTYTYYGDIPEPHRRTIEGRMIDSRAFFTALTREALPSGTVKVYDSSHSANRLACAEADGDVMTFYLACALIFDLPRPPSYERSNITPFDAVPHEYFHRLQFYWEKIEVRGVSSPPKWLIEGAAVYAETQYLIARKNLDIPSARQYRVDSVRHGGIEPLEHWVREWGTDTGWEYSLAYLAHEWLVARAGFDAFLGYWSQDWSEGTWEQGFADVFEISVNDFYEAFTTWREVGFPIPIPAPSASR